MQGRPSLTKAIRTLKHHSDEDVADAASKLKIKWGQLSKDPVEQQAYAAASKAAQAADAAAAAAAAAASTATVAAATVAADAATAALTAAAVAAAAAAAAKPKPKPQLSPSPSRQQAAERPSRADGRHTGRSTTRVLVGGQVGALKLKAAASTEKSKPIKEGWGPLRKGVRLKVPKTEFDVHTGGWRIKTEPKSPFPPSPSHPKRGPRALGPQPSTLNPQPSTINHQPSPVSSPGTTRRQ